jgi:hypothetical protein
MADRDPNRVSTFFVEAKLEGSYPQEAVYSFV